MRYLNIRPRNTSNECTTNVFDCLKFDRMFNLVEKRSLIRRKLLRSENIIYSYTGTTVEYRNKRHTSLMLFERGQ